ncbi:hypothetical protein [Streptomyces sp. NPDC006132]|uniref:hypothetical protein n=1 Tax=Streptomyces sp. NPDC006132 TaxID=3156732 RepID=UPI00340CC820
MGVRIRTEILVGGQWIDISGHVLNRQQVQLSWGRRDGSSRVTPAKSSPQLNNKGGLYSNRNPYSPYFGQLTQNTQIRQSVQLPDSTWEFLHHSEIPSWPKRWDLSGNDAYMPVETAGIMRRLGQGTKPLKDALRRHIDAHGPLAYWPLTDGETAREGTELVQGSQPMRAIGETGAFYQGQPNWGKGTLAPWLDPVVELPDETIGRLTAYVPPRTITGWSVDHVFAGGGTGFANTFEILDNGPRTDANNQVEWIINPDGNANDIDLFVAFYGDTISGSTLAASVANAGINDQSVHHIRLATADNGAGGTDWWFYLDGVQKASGTRPTPFRPVQRLTYRWGTVGLGGLVTEAMGLGHITYWGADAPPAIDTWRAVQGHARELAGRRIERLCAEQGVPLVVNGDLDITPAMGPQKPAAFLDLLQSAADVDGGAVYESRDAVGLAYRTRASKYNQ